MKAGINIRDARFTAVEWATMERRGKAHEHESQMLAKYGYSSEAYLHWQNKIDGQEYPLPYATGYYRRFFELFFSRGGESRVFPELSRAFVGDEADAFYIEELLVKADDYGLYTADTACVFGLDGDITLWHSGFSHPIGGMAGATILHGSETNKSRRDLIRRWLKQQAECAKDELLLPSAELPAEINSLSGYLHKSCTIEVCDEAARLIGLHLSRPPKSRQNLKVHAFTDALKSSSSLRAPSAVIDEIRLAVAARYNVADYNASYSPQHDKAAYGRNRTWDECQQKAYRCLEQLRK